MVIAHRALADTALTLLPLTGNSTFSARPFDRGESALLRLFLETSETILYSIHNPMKPISFAKT